MDADLLSRLRAAGADADDPPEAAWAALVAAEGDRATLIDRYALEAHSGGVAPGELSAQVRARLTREVLEMRWPGFEVSGAGRHDPVEIASSDPSWPDLFEEIAATLRRHLGDTALRIEHIGSTSVPGLGAKPVIDVLVAVPDVGDEAAYVAGVEAAGVELRSRDSVHRYFRPPPGTRRDRQIHVCGPGTPWERDHLLFRDYLRAHPGVAADYESVKRRLAADYRDDRIAYNEGKTGFIRDALDDAAAWAERSGRAP
jgi:GrpB-like predicted nucleotidyltransferase (UPF0157 family)